MRESRIRELSRAVEERKEADAALARTKLESLAIKEEAKNATPKIQTVSKEIPRDTDKKRGALAIAGPVVLGSAGLAGIASMIVGIAKDGKCTSSDCGDDTCSGNGACDDMTGATRCMRATTAANAMSCLGTEACNDALGTVQCLAVAWISCLDISPISLRSPMATTVSIPMAAMIPSPCKTSA